MKDTPSMTEVIESIINRCLVDLHTSLPGIIQSYDPEKKKADVKPALKRQFKNNQLEELNLITDVPVAFLQTNNFIFSIPLKKGDEVLLIFSERSLDKWLKSGKTINPEDPRKFDLSDAIAIPILKPFETGKQADPENALIEHGKSVIKISPNGTFAITNGKEEVINLIKELADACASIITNTQIGPQPPTNKAQFQQLSQRIGGLIL
ncbi:MAG: phage baseplate protein [Desulfobacteraceae bacterium]|nr:phage baseplate protein [Desulfobacteraceae bacterium]